MGHLPITQMVRDADALAGMTGTVVGEIRDSLQRDVACHVKALASEYERLKLYEQAMESVASQFICPKTDAKTLALMQLGLDAREKSPDSTHDPR